jgi:peptide/nickel transport system substrate-binding protein
MLMTVVAALILAGAGAPAPAQAQQQGNVLRFANSGDFLSMDEHFSGDAFAVGILLDVNEPLVVRNPEGRLEPALATEWERASPTVWRFKLRSGVRFHEGQPLTADDVVFSLERARHENSTFRPYLSHITAMRAVDAQTVEVTTAYPDPILLDKLRTVGIFSRAWAQAHDALAPASRAASSENYATRHANGTGPFMLREWEPGVRATFVANPNWWGHPQHNLAQAVFTRIANDATRTAALLAGDIDFAYAVPTQDIQRLQGTQGIRLESEPEIRVIYLYMDMWRDALLGSNITDRNPFKDVRVRRAVYQAIDAEAINTRIMRGQSRLSGSLFARGINGYREAYDQRAAPFDRAAAQRLLQEAGYPNGFEITMDCPNDRYLNDAPTCEAVVGMLARIGIRVNLRAQTRARWFAQILGPAYNSSFGLTGWAPIFTFDVHNVAANLLHSRKADQSAGFFNFDGNAIPRLDELTDGIETELDPARRQQMVDEIQRIHNEQFLTVPLYELNIIWAMRANVTAPMSSDNFFQLRYVRMGG